MRQQFMNEAIAHALRDFPRESCGVVIKAGETFKYVPCRNVATTPSEHFKMCAVDFFNAAEEGEVVEIVHSHPNTPADPSDADLVMCEESDVPWTIIAVYGDSPTGPYVKGTRTWRPSGYEAPLKGRVFCHGVLDCYSLVRDWVKREQGIELEDFDRPDEWWRNGQNLYMDNYAAAGYEPVKEGPPRRGDVILMQIRSKVPNHAGVMCSDTHMLHHMYNQLSEEVPYGGYWRSVTRLVLRRKST